MKLFKVNKNFKNYLKNVNLRLTKSKHTFFEYFSIYKLKKKQ